MTDTNKLTERITSVLEPRAALIAYATSNRQGGGYDEDYYVEARRIDSDGVMGEGCRRVRERTPRSHTVQPALG